MSIDGPNPDILKNKTIAIIGFGNQGKAQAQNLRDSGLHVVIGLRTASKSSLDALKLGFKVLGIAEACKTSDVRALLIPDEYQSEVFASCIQHHLFPGKTLLFAHGFNIHFKKIIPPQNIDVLMVSPKASGYILRSKFENKESVPFFYAIHQNVTGEATKCAYAYITALGGTTDSIYQTTFKDETIADLFSEQVVLCGGIPELIKQAYLTLIEAGISAETAYFECIYEVKLITDLIISKGINNFYQSISNTAEYGGRLAGKKIINQSTKDTMKKILKEIEDQTFSENFLKDSSIGYPELKRLREQNINLD